MTQPTLIRLRLRSAATFGRGEGLPGLVDQEIEHDRSGLPFMRGKTLKGLLAEEAESLVFALEELQRRPNWKASKNRLFGVGGTGLKGRGSLHVGDAALPEGLRQRLIAAKEKGDFTAEDILNGLTGIRRQTAMNSSGGPDASTLRSMRVLVRGVTLEARLGFAQTPDPDDLALLAASVLALRHAGLGRNRGRGWLSAELDTPDLTRSLFERFAGLLSKEVSA